MKEDKERWNSRFSSRPNTQPSAPGFIQDSVEKLQAGSVLDVASGDGAAALFLASKGFNTSAMDISDVALQRLNEFATKRNLIIETVVADLDDLSQRPINTNKFLEAFDNIVICHFKPKPEYWPLLISWLKPGGKLFISTFNLKHHTENGFSRRFCLEDSELLNIDQQLAVEHYESVDRDGDYMDDYMFIKK